MYKKFMVIGALIGSAMMASPVAAELKIGYLDVSRVAEESPQYQAARKDLQKELQRRENDLRSKAEKLKKLEDKFKRDSAVMSESEMKRLERDILSRQRKLKNARDEYRDELSLRQNEERNKLLRQVGEVVREIGKKDGYDLILTDGVAYYSKKMDLSDKVLSRLKSSFRR